MKQVFFTLLLVTSLYAAQAQLKVGNNPAAIDASAVLHLESSTKGAILPRMTTAARTAISTPAKGLVVLDTTLNQLMINTGTPAAPLWQNAGTGTNWSLSGNAGTVATTHFIGTTDNADISFRRNNLAFGLLGDNNMSLGDSSLARVTTGSRNTAYGAKTGVKITTGSDNVFIGDSTAASALPGTSRSVIIGSRAAGVSTLSANNVYVGYRAGFNSTGQNNVFLGISAGDSAFAGGNNVAIGNSALKNNNGGTINVAVGSNALSNNTTGIKNVAIGGASLDQNTTGESNTAVGQATAAANTTGLQNSIFGWWAFNQNTTGNYNSAFGSGALRNVINDSLNAAFGFKAIDSLTVGFENAAFGALAMGRATTGSYNSVLGTYALDSIGSSNNVAVGYQSGNTVTTSSNITLLGNQTNATATGLTNATAIGDKAYVAQSNSLILGSINGVNGATADTKVGIGTTAPIAALNIEAPNDITDGVSSTIRTAYFLSDRYDGTIPATQIIGLGNVAADAATNTSALNVLRGARSTATKNGTGTIGTLSGLESVVSVNNTGNITNLNAVSASMSVGPLGGNIQNIELLGTQGNVSGSYTGTIDNYTGLDVSGSGLSNASLNIQNKYGIKIKPVRSSTTIAGSTAYAIYTDNGRVSLGDTLQLRSTVTGVPANDVLTLDASGNVQKVAAGNVAVSNIFSANGTIGSNRTVGVTDKVSFDVNTFVIDGTNDKVGIGTTTPGSKLAVVGLPVYASNAAALTGGLLAGDFFRDASGFVRVVF